MSHPGKARALLATLRIANAPSVVSNVFLGYMLGWVRFGGADAGELASRPPWVPIASGLLLYFSGNLGNDWFDRKWDEEKRPERALPRGLFMPGSYLTAALASAAAGTGLAFSESWLGGVCALVIVSLIAVYTRFHKVAIWPVIPMGLCRASLYVLGFATWWPGWNHLVSLGADAGAVAMDAAQEISILAVGLFSYVAGLSLSARYEGMPDAPPGPRVISRAMLFVPFAAMSCQFMHVDPWKGLVGMIPFGIWLALALTRFHTPIPRYVSALLAGIPLVDFIAAAPIGLYLCGRIPQTHSWEIYRYPHLVAMLVVPLVAFVLGRALQKLAPAT